MGRFRLLVWVSVMLTLLIVLPELVDCTADPESPPASAAAAEEDGEDDEWEDFEDGESAFASSKDAIHALKVLPQVNDQNAQRILTSTEYMLLLGYAPWCKQSAAVMVDFAEAATVLAGRGSSVALAKIDAVASPVTANRYKIKGYPTILFITNGSAEIYNSGNTRDDFVNWVLKRTGSPATTFMSEVEAEELRNRNATVVVGFFDKFEGVAYEEFIAASKRTEDIEFVHTTNATAAKVFGEELGDEAPAIGIWKSEPENFRKFEGTPKKRAIVAFAALNRHPLVTKMNPRNVMKVYSSPIKKQLLLFSNSEDFESVYPLYLAGAKDFQGDLMFLWVDIEDEEFAKPMITAYGITESEPVLAAFDNNNGSRYLMEAEVTSDNLETFATNFKEGRLKLHYKSEPIPKKSKAGEVRVVVGKTYEKSVLKSSKDLLLLVYTPYCHECEALDKVFVKLAKHFKGVHSIVFAKLNAGANEHPLLEVSNFPKVLLYRAGDKNSPPVEALAKPNFKKLVKFVEENHVKLLAHSHTDPTDASAKGETEKVHESGGEARADVSVKGETKMVHEISEEASADATGTEKPIEIVSAPSAPNSEVLTLTHAANDKVLQKGAATGTDADIHHEEL